MAWDKYLKALKGSKRKKKDPKKRFSEMFMCKFNPDQMEFIKQNAEIYGSKANVIRNGLNLLVKQHQKGLQQISNNNS